MRVSAHCCADAFLNVSFSGFYRTGVRRQRTLCGIRIKSFATLFVSAPLCGDSDLCDPDRLSLIHISEPTRPLYISYAVFCLKKKNPVTILGQDRPEKNSAKC